MLLFYIISSTWLLTICFILENVDETTFFSGNNSSPMLYFLSLSHSTTFSKIHSIHSLQISCLANLQSFYFTVVSQFHLFDYVLATLLLKVNFFYKAQLLFISHSKRLTSFLVSSALPFFFINDTNIPELYDLTLILNFWSKIMIFLKFYLN